MFAAPHPSLYPPTRPSPLAPSLGIQFHGCSQCTSERLSIMNVSCNRDRLCWVRAPMQSSTPCLYEGSSELAISSDLTVFQMQSQCFNSNLYISNRIVKMQSNFVSTESHNTASVYAEEFLARSKVLRFIQRYHG